MAFLPAYLNARKRRPNLDSPAEANDRTDSRPVFELVPPRVVEDEETEKILFEEASPEATPQPGRNVHPIGESDLSRLSIDNDGRLYWDGKPVEVRRRILMSRAQVIGASLIAAFVVMGALGAVIQGSAAARDWACRLGWSSSYCTLPAPMRGRSDIPA